MGQTQGGNSGNLELLKKFEEQRAEIEQLRESIVGMNKKMATVYITAVLGDRGTAPYPDGFTKDNSRVVEIAVERNDVFRIGVGAGSMEYTRNFVELYPTAISFLTTNVEEDGKRVRITLAKV